MKKGQSCYLIPIELEKRSGSFSSSNSTHSFLKGGGMLPIELDKMKKGPAGLP